MKHAAEDFDFIRSRRERMREIADRMRAAGEKARSGICQTRNGGNVVDCFCYQANPEGGSLPCPPRDPDPEPPTQRHKLTDPLPVPWRF